MGANEFTEAEHPRARDGKFSAKETHEPTGGLDALAAAPARLTVAEKYGGYGITKFKEAGGEETVRFEARLTRDGKEVARVSNGGTGGENTYWFHDDAEEERFEEFAADWNKDSEWAGYGDSDQLVDRLATIHRMNRARSVMFVLDGDDFWRTGTYRQFRSGITPEQAATHLRTDRATNGKKPAIWDKETGDFEPVE